MSQPLPPGWTDGVRLGAASPDEATRAKALGVEPRRCYRVDGERKSQSRKRGSQRGVASRYALKNLPPIESDDY